MDIMLTGRRPIGPAISLLGLLMLGGCAAKVVAAPAAPVVETQSAYQQCVSQAAAATAGLTVRRGAAESRLFSQCMAAKAPGDPAAAP